MSRACRYSEKIKRKLYFVTCPRITQKNSISQLIIWNLTSYKKKSEIKMSYSYLQKKKKTVDS